MAPWPAQALHAALERPGPPPAEGDALPPFWRWLYFLEAAPPSRLGRDGHPAPGAGLIPDTGLPRRMWAGGRVTYHRPLILGQPARLISRVAAVAPKQGRSGPLCFVTLRHEAHDAGGLAEIEEQDLVYREDASPDPSSQPASPRPASAAPSEPRATQAAVWRRDWRADATLLFRYSALTFNGHRIHYDLDYARGVEGYAGLVVHGPLLATLMLDLVAEQGPKAAVAEFAFRAKAPVFADDPFTVCGAPTAEGADLWVENKAGGLAMAGSARFR